VRCVADPKESVYVRIVNRPKGGIVICLLAMACSPGPPASSNVARPVPSAAPRDTCWADAGGRAPERHWAWERFKPPLGTAGILPPGVGQLPMPVACTLTRPPPPGTLLGSPSDVQTTPGLYDGYEVHNDCEAKWPGFELVVHGHGTDRFPEQRGPPWGEADLVRQSLEKEACEATGVSSIHVSDFPTNNCHGDIYLYLHDWRDLDTAVRGIGTWMKCRNVGVDVVLRVEPVPKPPTLI
jgi:hypothetical protein